MPVKDGVVRKMFIEPEKAGDRSEVSDADTMLASLNPGARKPDRVAVFARDGCGFCAKAKALLTGLGYDCAEIPLADGERILKPLHPTDAEKDDLVAFLESLDDGVR